MEKQLKELEKVKAENYRLATELVKLKEATRIKKQELFCPLCDELVKPSDSRVKVTEHVRNPKKKSWQDKAWSSRTLQNFHPTCWEKWWKEKKKK